MAEVQKRKLFHLGEILTLLAMALAVVSGMLVWKDDTPQLPSAVGTYFVRRIHLNGFDPRMKIGALPIGWIVVLCAVIGAMLLLWEATGNLKRAFLAVQLALGVAVLALALLHLAPQPGVILAILVGLLLIGGAVARYR